MDRDSGWLALQAAPAVWCVCSVSVAAFFRCNNKLVLILTRHTLARAGLALIGQPPVLDRHEVVTDNGDVDTLRQATP